MTWQFIPEPFQFEWVSTRTRVSSYDNSHCRAVRPKSISVLYRLPTCEVIEVGSVLPHLSERFCKMRGVADSILLSGYYRDARQLEIEHIGEAAFGWLQHKIGDEWAVLVTGEDWVRDYTVIRRTSQQMWMVFKERLKITFLDCWVIDQLFKLRSFR